MTERRKVREAGTANILFQLALRNLRRHWVRSLLAMIGIIIGVIAIASMGILGNSIALLFSGFWSDVSDTVLITPHLAVSTGDPGDPRNVLPSTLSEKDVIQIEKAVGQEHRVIPMVRSTEKIGFGDKVGYAMLYALKSDDIPYLLDTEAGIYPKGSSSGCMMGSLLADEYGVKAGNRIELGNESVRVVGVVEERGWGLDINPDFAIIVTQEWYAKYSGGETFNQVVVIARDLEDIDAIKESVDHQLNRRKEVVDIVDSREIIELFQETLDGMTIFLQGIGAVSLFVASVSILNVMIISVTERTQEIGILRGIGTRRRDVMLMFLFEALGLGIIGSLIGGALSSVVGYIVSVAMNQAFDEIFGLGTEITFFDPTILGYIVFGMIFGIFASIIAGLYPAWKASLLNPIDALRYE
jgi:putative ABC transport system permease protein